MCTCMNYELQHKICTQHQQTIIDSIKHLVHKSKAILVMFKLWYSVPIIPSHGKNLQK